MISVLELPDPATIQRFTLRVAEDKGTDKATLYQREWRRQNRERYLENNRRAIRAYRARERVNREHNNRRAA